MLGNGTGFGTVLCGNGTRELLKLLDSPGKNLYCLVDLKTLFLSLVVCFSFVTLSFLVLVATGLADPIGGVFELAEGRLTGGGPVVVCVLAGGGPTLVVNLVGGLNIFFTG